MGLPCSPEHECNKPVCTHGQARPRRRSAERGAKVLALASQDPLPELLAAAARSMRLRLWRNALPCTHTHTHTRTQSRSASDARSPQHAVTCPELLNTLADRLLGPLLSTNRRMIPTTLLRAPRERCSFTSKVAASKVRVITCAAPTQPGCDDNDNSANTSDNDGYIEGNGEEDKDANKEGEQDEATVTTRSKEHQRTRQRYPDHARPITCERQRLHFWSDVCRTSNADNRRWKDNFGERRSRQ